MEETQKGIIKRQFDIPIPTDRRGVRTATTSRVGGGVIGGVRRYPNQSTEGNENIERRGGGVIAPNGQFVGAYETFEDEDEKSWSETLEAADRGELAAPSELEVMDSSEVEVEAQSPGTFSQSEAEGLEVDLLDIEGATDLSRVSMALPTAGRSLEEAFEWYQAQFGERGLTTAKQYLDRLPPASKLRFLDTCEMKGLRMEDMLESVVLEEHNLERLEASIKTVRRVYDDLAVAFDMAQRDNREGLRRTQGAFVAQANAMIRKIEALEASFKTTSDALIDHVAEATEKLEQATGAAYQKFAKEVKPEVFAKGVAYKAKDATIKLVTDDLKKFVEDHMHAVSSNLNRKWGYAIVITMVVAFAVGKYFK